MVLFLQKYFLIFLISSGRVWEIQNSFRSYQGANTRVVEDGETFCSSVYLLLKNSEAQLQIEDMMVKTFPFNNDSVQLPRVLLALQRAHVLVPSSVCRAVEDRLLSVLLWESGHTSSTLTWALGAGGAHTS